MLDALKNSGLDKNEIKKLFAEADLDGTGGIDVEEFIKLMEATGMHG